jgi:endonuclease/exonuclease/phosphatase family metal-dependent hydrolase
MSPRASAITLFVVALVLALAASDDALAGPRGPRAPRGRFRAMSFNIRFDFENDGPNRWPNRVPLVAKVIKDSGAAVIGLQEDKGEQIDDLKPLLPGYEFLGRGRNENGSGERCTIVVKSADVRVRDSGSFWLSDTPDVQGSNTWGDRYPRVVTWALLEVEGKRTPLLVLNTHLPERDDGRDPENRVRGTRVMHDWLARRIPAKDRDDAAILIFGDYNSKPDEAPRAALVGEGDDGLRIRDAFVEARPNDPAPGTINNNFSGARTASRIDWILLAGPLRAHTYVKLDEQVDGRWPSDHYPVLADLELR